MQRVVVVAGEHDVMRPDQLVVHRDGRPRFRGMWILFVFFKEREEAHGVLPLRQHHEVAFIAVYRQNEEWASSRSSPEEIELAVAHGRRHHGHRCRRYVLFCISDVVVEPNLLDLRTQSIIKSMSRVKRQRVSKKKKEQDRRGRLPLRCLLVLITEV